MVGPKFYGQFPVGTFIWKDSSRQSPKDTVEKCVNDLFFNIRKIILYKGCVCVFFFRDSTWRYMGSESAQLLVRGRN